MVEGPGCKLKGEKIRTQLSGQKVQTVREKTTVGKKIAAKHGKKDLMGFSTLNERRLDEVQTLGKELFMYFGHLCLRVHFLMNGSFRINSKHTDPDSSSSKSQSPVLLLDMTKDSLAFYDASVGLRSSEECREKYESLKSLDICSPVFNHKQAFDLIQHHRDRLVCDVLLDQVVLPGVGNIIKNEALFDSGIKPDTKVGELNDEHIKHLIKMTRDFSMLFYECRKTGVTLSKYMKVYGREKCGQCHGKLTLCRMGDVNDRVTYFCPTCQTNNLKDNAQRLPVKNSLLGWLQNDNNKSFQNEWTCSACTLINKPHRSTCLVCLSPNSSSINTKGEACPTLQSKKRMLDSPLMQVSKRPCNGKDTRPENPEHSSQKDVKQKIPNCPGHKVKCNMREVRKEGENLHRMFFTCSLPRAKQCQFFKWADENFPICAGHGKPCTLRTVMKIGPNNGKKFFACNAPRNKQCQYFQWAEGYG